MSIIVANWKMNLNLLSGEDLARKISMFVEKEKSKDTIVICPSFSMLDRVGSAINGSFIKLGAQDCSHYRDGAYTGDVSAAMLKDTGCEYVIIGHSERRSNHNETPSLIRRKVASAHLFDLKTIICIGETEEERINGMTLEVLKEQLLKSIPENSIFGENILIAYEPLWSIGTGIIPSVNDINEIAEYCSGILATRFLFENKIKILYGGSVDSANCTKILNSDYVDGILVGSASLDYKKFSEIIMASNKLCKQS